MSPRRSSFLGASWHSAEHRCVAAIDAFWVTRTSRVYRSIDRGKDINHSSAFRIEAIEGKAGERDKKARIGTVAPQPIKTRGILLRSPAAFCTFHLYSSSYILPHEPQVATAGETTISRTGAP